MNLDLHVINQGIAIDDGVSSDRKRENAQMLDRGIALIREANMGKGSAIVSEAFHTGLGNLNFRRYSAKGMDKAIASFYDPHVTPFLMFHNDYQKAVGTNVLSQYFKRKVETPTGLADGYGKVVTFINKDAVFEDEPVVRLLQDKRISSLSIGSRINRDNVLCSICHKPIFGDECEHEPGKMYDEQICLMDIYSPLFREYSGVYSPADIYAMVSQIAAVDEAGKPRENVQTIVDNVHGLWTVSVYENVTDKFYSADSGIQNAVTELRSADSTVTVKLVDALLVAHKETLIAKDELIAILKSGNQPAESPVSADGEKNDPVENTDTENSTEESQGEGEPEPAESQNQDSAGTEPAPETSSNTENNTEDTGEPETTEKPSQPSAPENNETKSNQNTADGVQGDLFDTMTQYRKSIQTRFAPPTVPRKIK